MTGKVKMFDDRKGYGFIIPDGGGPDVFVHHRTIQMVGFKTLTEGDLVRYEMGNHDGRPCAQNVVPLGAVE